MNDFLSNDELDAMFDQEQQPQYQDPIVPVMDYPAPVPLYSLQLAQAPAPEPQVEEQPSGLLVKKVGPLPVWAWASMGMGVLGTGYFFWRSRKVTPNTSDSSESAPGIGDIVSKVLNSGSDSGWSPSRSRYADQMSRYFQRKGMSDHVKVWHDAEEARDQGGLSVVSPLINIQVKSGTVKVDPALQRFCRRDGLNAVQHPDGSIGLYPHSSKRGKEWEEYIDALRDDGQKV